MSRTFAVYPQDEKAPNPTDSTIQAIITVLSVLNAAINRKVV